MNHTDLSESYSGKGIPIRNTENRTDSSAGDNVFVLCSVLYLLLTTTRLFSFWKEHVNIYSVDVDKAAVDPLSVALGNILGLFMLFYFVRNKTDLTRIVRENKLIFFVFLFSLISCTWSQLPFVAFKRWLKVFYLLLIVLNIITSQNPAAILRKIVLIYSKVTISISLLFILFFHKFGWMPLQGEYLARGIFSHKNALANISALVILLTVWVEFHFKNSPGWILRRNWFWLGGSLICLFLSKGKTSWGGFLIAIFLFLVVLIAPGRKRQDKRAVLSILFLLPSIFLLQTVISNVNLYELAMGYALNIAGKDPTFTGRTEIWNVLINLGLSTHPILGSGFQSLFLGTKSIWLLNYLDWNAPDSHNSFVEMFLELGVIGVVSFVCIMIFLIVAVFRKIFVNDDPKDIMTFSIIFFLTFCGMFEASLFMCNSFAFFSLLVIIFLKNIKNRSDTISRSFSN